MCFMHVAHITQKMIPIGTGSCSMSTQQLISDASGQPKRGDVMLLTLPGRNTGCDLTLSRRVRIIKRWVSEKTAILSRVLTVPYLLTAILHMFVLLQLVLQSCFDTIMPSRRC